jgi:DNA polymerase
MESSQEIRGFFENLRDMLEAHRDIGMEPPPVRAAAPAEVPPAAAGIPGTVPHSGDSLEVLREFIGDCTRCKLHAHRHLLVFGEGPPQARLVFVGEAPGREEDMEGRPFVGEAGKLLTRIIEKGMGLSRTEVYICNVVKCRPPGNREPDADEISTCLPFLERQLSILSPEVICSLGRIAGQALLGDAFKITLERGKWREYRGVPLLPTFHPAYLLRNPAAKRAVWEDVQEMMRRLGLEIRPHG